MEFKQKKKKKQEKKEKEEKRQKRRTCCRIISTSEPDFAVNAPAKSPYI